MELLVTITIITILTSIMVTGTTGFRDRARRTKTRAQIAQMETALEAYRNDFLRYPNDASPTQYEEDNSYILEQLSGRDMDDGVYSTAITGDARWNGPYFEPKSEDVVMMTGAGGTPVRTWVDAWGSLFNIRLANDTTIEASNPYPPHNRPLSFDIWSSGPNKTNNSGTNAASGLGGDDIGNF